MTDIKHLLVLRITEHLETELQTNISKSDKARATLVKAYRFQDSPLENYIYLYITDGDPADPKYRDARVSAEEQEKLGMRIPVGEVGGGHYWWIRGRVVIGAYFVTKNYAQEDAANYAHTVMGRAKYALERTRVADLCDTYGEQAYLLSMHASAFTEGGGPPDQYLWRGEIWWQVLTRRPI